MNNNDRKHIEDNIKSAEEWRDEFFKFKANTNFQLRLAQLTFFQIISSIIVGLVGIAYLSDFGFNHRFLEISFLFAIVTCILSVSFTREVIDLSESENNKMGETLNKMITGAKNSAQVADQNNDRSIYFDRKKEIDLDKQKNYLNYIGEIIVFTFYLSLGFLMIAIVSKKYNFELFSYQTVILIVLVYLLSFKNWAIRFSKILSKGI